MPTTLYLFDATYELFRNHFAIKGLTDPEGNNVGATYGLMNTMIAHLSEHDVTHIGCATDTTITSWRNDLYDGYKSGEGVPADLFAQFALAERALEALGLRVWRMDDFEADDAVATAAHRFSADFDQVVICSVDKDFAQCIDGARVVMWDRRRDKWYDEDAVLEKWGVPPAAIPSWLALVGDAADGLPGIPRWGAKSSATVLREYGCVADIPTDHEQWSVKVRGARGLSENLEANREDALLFEQLATLRTDANVVDSDLSALEWTGIDREALLQVCDQLGFGRIIERADALAEKGS